MKFRTMFFALALTACAVDGTTSTPPDEPAAASDGPAEGSHGTTRVRHLDGTIEEVRYTVHQGHMFWEGDIDLGRAPAHANQRSLAIKGLDHRWPDGLIDWQFEPGSVVPQAAIRAAIAEYELLTPLRFHEGVTGTRPYITFKDSTRTNVSFTTGIGPDDTDPGDETDINVWKTHGKGIVLHEMGHAIGLAHEAKRSDRDSVIDFDSGCSTDDGQFSTEGSDFELLGAYDITSIMQYGSANFCEQADPGDFHTAVNNCTCYPIVKKGFSHFGEAGFINQPGDFSAQDLRAIWRMYEPKIGVATAGDKFGSAFARGDFNNDGFQDLAVGAPNNNGLAGGVFMYMGSEAGLVNWKSTTSAGLAAATSSEEFGGALATGDFDGDGFADLAVASPTRTTNGALVAGTVFVMWGSRAGITPGVGIAITQSTLGGVDQFADGFGTSLAVGDFDGDGRVDLAIGAPTKMVGGARIGVVYVARSLGASRAFQSYRLLTEPAPAAALDNFGYSLAVADFDNNGSPDLAVGAPGAYNSASPGRVLVFTGIRTGATTAWAIEQSTSGNDAPAGGDQFGKTIAVGHFDGTVYANTSTPIRQLVIGAPGKNNPADSGRLFVERPVWLLFNGNRFFAGFNQAQFFGQSSLGGTNSANDQLGTSLAVADFDGDGLDDVVAGIPGKAFGSYTGTGEVALYRGGSATPLTGAAVYTESPLFGIAANDAFGTAVITGDFNRDGLPDYVGGAPGRNGGAMDYFFGAGGTPFNFPSYFDQATRSQE